MTNRDHFLTRWRTARPLPGRLTLRPIRARGWGPGEIARLTSKGHAPVSFRSLAPLAQMIVEAER